MPDSTALFKLDRTLQKACKPLTLSELKKSDDYFNYLVKSVVYQQLSTKAAGTIYQRFTDLFKGPPGPELLLRADMAMLRSVGLSGQKSTYVRNIAEYALDKGMAVKRLDKLDDEQLLAELTGIKGVGKWTVEMMMIFAMLRPNVFPYDDLGIQQGMAGIYKLDPANRRQLIADMKQIASGWEPHRSLATRYIWAWKNANK